MKRFSVLSLMAAVALVAVGLAAMRAGSEQAERLTLTGVFLALALGLLGAIVRRGPGWIGFALFSWLYVAAVYFTPSDLDLRHRMVMEPFLLSLTDRLYDIPPAPPELPFDVEFQKGVFQKKINHRLVALSSDEQTLVNQWQSGQNARSLALQDQNRALIHAKEIGCAFLSLFFGIIGALLGLLLEPQRVRNSTSVAGQPSSTP